MFFFGFPKFIDINNIITKPSDQKANIYGFNAKIINPCEWFGFDGYLSIATNSGKADYGVAVGDLKKEDVKSSL